MPIEIDSLRRLNCDLAENWVPRVYASGNGCAQGHSPFPMFVGQWFVDFHEVHRTPDKGCEPQWVVWDDSGHWGFGMPLAGEFYRQAVLILTGCFDPFTLSAILDWHHAAGDFVVRKNAAGLSVRLITVRRYAPLFLTAGEEPLDAALLLDALAAFWMRTSMWMRIDRLDGVGELVWSDDQTIGPMWEGFIQGLRFMAQSHAFADDFIDAAGHFFAAHSAREWLELGVQIAGRYPAGLPESALIKQHVDRHASHTAIVARQGKDLTL